MKEGEEEKRGSSVALCGPNIERREGRRGIAPAPHRHQRGEGIIRPLQTQAFPGGCCPVCHSHSMQNYDTFFLNSKFYSKKIRTKQKNTRSSPLFSLCRFFSFPCGMPPQALLPPHWLTRSQCSDRYCAKNLSFTW